MSETEGDSPPPLLDEDEDENAPAAHAAAEDDEIEAVQQVLSQLSSSDASLVARATASLNRMFFNATEGSKRECMVSLLAADAHTLHVLIGQLRPSDSNPPLYQTDAANVLDFFVQTPELAKRAIEAGVLPPVMQALKQSGNDEQLQVALLWLLASVCFSVHTRCPLLSPGVLFRPVFALVLAAPSRGNIELKRQLAYAMRVLLDTKRGQSIEIDEEEEAAAIATIEQPIIAAPASTAAAAAAVHSVPPAGHLRSPAERCATDALAHVFSFLCVHDVFSAYRVSRGWTGMRLKPESWPSEQLCLCTVAQAAAALDGLIVREGDSETFIEGAQAVGYVCRSGSLHNERVALVVSHPLLVQALFHWARQPTQRGPVDIDDDPLAVSLALEAINHIASSTDDANTNALLNDEKSTLFKDIIAKILCEPEPVAAATADDGEEEEVDQDDKLVEHLRLVKLVLWLLSNLLYSPSANIAKAIDAGLVPLIVARLSIPSSSSSSSSQWSHAGAEFGSENDKLLDAIREGAAWCVINPTSKDKATDEQRQFFVQQGALKGLCEVLMHRANANNVLLLSHGLDSLAQILSADDTAAAASDGVGHVTLAVPVAALTIAATSSSTGGASPAALPTTAASGSAKSYLSMLCECGGREWVAALRSHAAKEVRDAAMTFYQQFFFAKEDEE